MGVPSRLDHLVYFCPDLEAGIAEMEAKLGNAPARGGSHPGFGTCNALMSLGDNVYLELLAPDPDAKSSASNAWLETMPKGGGLATWVMRCANIEEVAELGRQAGAAIGAIIEGKRAAPDGTLLEWRLSHPAAMPFDGCVPFLIDWGTSPHPSGTAPHGGTLTGFAIEHPQADALRAVFEAMGEAVDVREGPTAKISAVIEGKHGPVTLS